MKASFPYATPATTGLFPNLRSPFLAVTVGLTGVLLAIALWLSPLSLPLPDLTFLSGATAPALPVAYTQGMQLRQTGDLIGARQKLQQAAIADPMAVPVLYQLGRAEFQLGNLEAAIAAYRAALAQDADHAPSAYELGSMLVTLGQIDDGIALLQQSVAIAPTVLGYYDLGISLGRSGDRRGEINSLQQAIALQPDHADSHLNLGLSYAYLGDIAAAKRHLTQARNLYQAQIEALEHAHLGRNSLDAQILDQMMATLDRCGVDCWRS
ncbi:MULTISPECIES: tetratricopeptide repeat protein [Cyanophyceae]|uniref:Tetratricopeptide repeat protein n=1 Tax=Leptolyngbya subtilissima DQ-A4 TaxID=2933933 RepID=A0ABV0KBF5_9CYAN|nr:tetratricopeptide repeat protein [Nodosilinea sp. FACHB-141]MBD2115082.1 tetratricopeptide repeat protein [Nodosilinea sp. FACHB-141]